MLGFTASTSIGSITEDRKLSEYIIEWEARLRKRYCEECVSGERRPEERTECMYLQDEMYPGE